jgi:hypothetical protein
MIMNFEEQFKKFGEVTVFDVKDRQIVTVKFADFEQNISKAIEVLTLGKKLGLIMFQAQMTKEGVSFFVKKEYVEPEKIYA